MNLYEIDTRLLKLIDEIEDAGGEITDEQNFDLDALLDARDDKGDGYIAVIKQLEAEADAYGAEAERLAKLKKSAAAKVDRLKSRLLDSMVVHGQDVIQGKLGKVRVQYASSSRIEVLAAPEDLPERFRRVKIEADKTALKNALADQDEEAVRFAEVAESRTPYIRIY